MFDEKLREYPHNKPIILDNISCVYCGQNFEACQSTKEHVIGRSFVPKGSFANQWNLIVKACGDCNRYKADLEDDISAITMQPDSAGNFAVDDPILQIEALRKGARSRSRFTGKPVSNSASKLVVDAPLMPGVQATFNMTGDPLIAVERIHALARMQLVGFFYLITYNEGTRKGGYWIGGFTSVMHALRSDWGNDVHKAFMNSTLNWEPRFLGLAADGFFKVVIRRHSSEECWSWALEWNHNHRIIGYFGNEDVVRSESEALPNLRAKIIHHGGEGMLAIRSEIPLAEKEDVMFALKKS